MDGRDVMALSSGSSPYYIHSGGVGGSGHGSQVGSLNQPPGFRPLSNPNLPPQSISRAISSGSAFSSEQGSAGFGHGINMAAPPGGGSMSEPVKKKRGRPRKYAPDGQVSLGLSPLPLKPKPSPVQDPNAPKKNRGRPPGTGRKQQLAALGEWMNNSAGIAFSPHVVYIGAGEDIVAKLLSFAQRRPRAFCILSGTGTVSAVTLCAPASSEPTLTYEGRFDILCLSGSYLVAEEGGPRNRTGGISVSLSSPEGNVIGGAAKVLMAAAPVQVVACSFVYDASKSKIKPLEQPEKDATSPPVDKSAVTPVGANTPQNYTSRPVSSWPGSPSVDMRNSRNDIDLMRG